MDKVQIFATDIDELGHFQPLIDSGIYPYEQLKRIPEDLFEKYFLKTAKADYFQLIPQIHNAVRFYKHDLLKLQKIDYNFDLLICKNVLLHFTAPQRIDVLKMFYQSLKSTGLLVMEQTQKIPPELQSHFKQLTPQAQLFGKI
jgi:chemotaxis protein methyltransferase CheR